MGTQDRRIRKTRAVLKSSLLSLMKEKSVKHITVKELCDKADINRGTFYLHYTDVFDMLEQISAISSGVSFIPLLSQLSIMPKTPNTIKEK